MFKQMSPIKGTTLFGLLIILTVLFAQKFYTPPDVPSTIPVSGMFELLGVTNSIVITLLSTIAVCIHLFSKGKFNKYLLIAISVFSLFIAISLNHAGWKYGSFTVASIFITYVYLFDILHRMGPHKKVVTFFKYFSSISAILPLFLYVLLPASREMLESYEGHFKGFETSRTTYGFIACIAFTLHLIERRRGWLVCIILILVGIFMAQSRTAAVLFFVVTVYTLIYDERIRRRKIVFGVITLAYLMIFLAFGARGGEALEETHRQLLIVAHVNYAMDNFWLGYGGNIVLDTMVMNDGQVIFKPNSAHNFLIETLVGFGMPVTILWLIILLSVWCKLNRTSKVLFLLLFGYGTFHNGFGLGVLTPLNFIILMLSASVKNYFSETNYDPVARIKFKVDN
jgi:hypothetical protein